MDQPSAVTHLLYLHGFRSSPQSMKAMKMAQWVARHRPGLTFWCPQLPPSPAEAMALVRQTLDTWPTHMAVMGSSLGGFYATWVAEHLPSARHAPVVLINPAVDPARDLARYIGEQTAWHNPQERFFFQPHFVDELRQLGQPPLTDPQRYQVWAATADEVLDWHDMQARYAHGQLQVVQGSDHALSDFDQHQPWMLRHLGLAG
ncbi:MAG TPA: YqiA/YcfP family alpha/beta fold hydrolase [Burkholderiaceae bacterium]|nr:YqiA/YcfP family alpha/beta fold hydrolase [Burkholderiaceae bacterium]